MSNNYHLLTRIVLKIIPSVSLEGRDLVEKLLTRDPLKRIDASKALQHPWITRRALRQRQTIINDNNDQLFGTDEFACTIS